MSAERPFLRAGVVVEGRVRVVTALNRKNPDEPEGGVMGFLASVPFWHLDERPREEREPDCWCPNERFAEVRTR